MTYVDGFVVAVPTDRKDEFRDHAASLQPFFREYGTIRVVEAWGDDVPDGKQTDFRRPVKAEEGESVVFAWFEWPSKEVRDAANEKMRSNQRMAETGAAAPFDAKRMIFGGFRPILEENFGGGTSYVDGFVAPVPAGRKDAYRAMAEKMAAAFRRHGTSRVVEAWGDDVPDGKLTDFKGAVQAEEGEIVVFSWTEWPSKEARDEGWKKVMADPDMQPDPANMPFDGKRMIYGGFAPLIDE
jgi:uncharacterized protein YbaA (DUF1428 family)